MPNNGARDFFGNPLPDGTTVIGACQEAYGDVFRQRNLVLGKRVKVSNSRHPAQHCYINDNKA
jgi:hypothetical protein